MLSLSLYAPPRRKRALATRGLLPSGYTARDLVRDVLVPSRRLLSSHRVSTRHSRQTSDTNRLSGRNKSPGQICPTCSIVPMLPAIRYLRAPLRAGNYPRAYKESRRSGDLRIQRRNRIRYRTVQKALPCVVSVRKRRATDSDRK